MENIKLLLLNGYFFIYDLCYVIVILVVLCDNVVVVVVMEVVNIGDKCNMNVLRFGYI